MKRARVYDVRNGDTDYRNLLSDNRDFIFWNEDILKDTRSGEVVFFVNREQREVLYTVATSVLRTGARSRRSWLKEFEYKGSIYGAKEGDEFRMYKVRQAATIPTGWKWTHPLRRNNIAELSISETADNTARLTRLHDLKQLFPKGPAPEVLEMCNLHVEGVNLTVNEQKIEMKLVGPPRSKKAVKGLENGKTGLTFSHPYRQLLMAVKTKPFVLLSGVSGTGKSWLVRKLAYITCADAALRNTKHPGNFEMVRVRPDWHEPNELLGYLVTQGGIFRYQCTGLLRFIVRACRYPHIPFFACLDEMNLARIEHYFSDFLSILETARWEGDMMAYDAFISSHDVFLYSQEDPGFWAKLGIEGDTNLQAYFLERGIVMPANLIVIGTINMDETTHTISQRVLDRTMVIEIQGVDMKHGATSPAETWKYPDTYEAATALITGRLSGSEAYNNNAKAVDRITDELTRLSKILEDSPFALSYRVREDVILYCAYNEALAANGLMPGNWLNICLDEAICMKILTRIAGDDADCGGIIERLQTATMQYPACQRKLSRIQQQLRKTGLTSFW
ncbi:McrB family protein [Chitinophaga ginsengisoli]|uniref:Dynein-related subfamily AAA family protein n=1 Tax=Chitinophaga ginsengisoli TaxID=363837 RepID=A0A2P8FZC2_9BACT|nr:AAA family ATPase [Chitinophaga ginsengisoli]PSL27069.1 dynein-related subfamily AAA family protein [Chitinophaga ginsengisoli]